MMHSLFVQLEKGLNGVSVMLHRVCYCIGRSKKVHAQSCLGDITQCMCR